MAKHYGVSVAICPARRGNRKGVVEKINHTAAQRWWRTLADELSVEAAQASVDSFARGRGDTRIRATADGRFPVATVAKTEPLAPLPAAPYPVIITEARTASRQALVSYRGNRYSVPPELAAAAVVVSRPLDSEHVDIATTAGIVVARHRLAADGLGVTVRGQRPRHRTRCRRDVRGQLTAPTSTQRTHPARARCPGSRATPRPHRRQITYHCHRSITLHSNRFHRHRPVRL